MTQGKGLNSSCVRRGPESLAGKAHGGRIRQPDVQSRSTVLKPANCLERCCRAVTTGKFARETAGVIAEFQCLRSVADETVPEPSLRGFDRQQAKQGAFVRMAKPAVHRKTDYNLPINALESKVQWGG